MQKTVFEMNDAEVLDSIQKEALDLSYAIERLPLISPEQTDCSARSSRVREMIQRLLKMLGQ
jgi:hypothetical protein